MGRQIYPTVQRFSKGEGIRRVSVKEKSCEKSCHYGCRKIVHFQFAKLFETAQFCTQELGFSLFTHEKGSQKMVYPHNQIKEFSMMEKNISLHNFFFMILSF